MQQAKGKHTALAFFFEVAIRSNLSSVKDRKFKNINLNKKCFACQYDSLVKYSVLNPINQITKFLNIIQCYLVFVQN